MISSFSWSMVTWYGLRCFDTPRQIIKNDGKDRARYHIALARFHCAQINLDIENVNRSIHGGKDKLTKINFNGLFEKKIKTIFFGRSILL